MLLVLPGRRSFSVFTGEAGADWVSAAIGPSLVYSGQFSSPFSYNWHLLPFLPSHFSVSRILVEAFLLPECRGLAASTLPTPAAVTTAADDGSPA